MKKGNLCVSFVLACFAAAGQTSQLTTVATGLNNPRAVVFGPGGSMYVAEAGLGAGNGSGGAADGLGFTGSIAMIHGSGSSHPTLRRILTGLASSAETPGGVVGPDGISLLGNGDLFIIMAESTAGKLSDDPNANPAIAAQLGKLLKASQGGQFRTVADVGGFNYQWSDANKDAPWAPAGQFPDANPYAVLALPGEMYVVDAASNTLNEVLHDGSVRIVAFVPNPLLPATPGGPPVIPISDSVPTCVAQGPDGFLYVGTLAFGANFARFRSTSPAFWATLPPQSKIYRVNPNALNAILTDADVWASGLNPITGCGFGPGAFYVTEYETQASHYASGDVVRIAINPNGSAGARSAMGTGALKFPNGFALGPDGAVYVSNHSTSPGVPQHPGDPVGEVVRVNH